MKKMIAAICVSAALIVVTDPPVAEAASTDIRFVGATATPPSLLVYGYLEPRSRPAVRCLRDRRLVISFGYVGAERPWVRVDEATSSGHGGWAGRALIHAGVVAVKAHLRAERERGCSGDRAILQLSATT